MNPKSAHSPAVWAPQKRIREYSSQRHALRSQPQDFAERHPFKIVLIDGEQLTSLMIRYNVGARIEQTYATSSGSTKILQHSGSSTAPAPVNKYRRTPSSLPQAEAEFRQNAAGDRGRRTLPRRRAENPSVSRCYSLHQPQHQPRNLIRLRVQSEVPGIAHCLRPGHPSAHPSAPPPDRKWRARPRRRRGSKSETSSTLPFSARTQSQKLPALRSQPQGSEPGGAR